MKVGKEGKKEGRIDKEESQMGSSETNSPVSAPLFMFLGRCSQSDAAAEG
jgi:hypothetical protein